MGNKIEKKLIVIVSLLCVTSALTYMKKDSHSTQKNRKSLINITSSISGYDAKRQIKMDQEVYDSLDLDAHVYTDFKKDNTIITLYIGYYYTADKVSSAHSPLVCFPAQGWDLGNPIVHSIVVENEKIKYAEMIGTLGHQKTLIIYWYQTYLNTTPYTHIEKVYALYNRLIERQEQNAFVRITISLENLSQDEAHKAGKEFICAFYPKFKDFIKKK